MKIIIAGAGKRGIRFVNLLKQIGIYVDAFIDNDPEKVGTEITGVPCFSIDYFKEQADDCRIYISVAKADELEKQLMLYYPNIHRVNINVSIGKEHIISSNPGYESFYPIGHFYSLYPIVSDVISESDPTMIADPLPVMQGGVDLNDELQNSIWEKMLEYYKEVLKWNYIEEEDDRGYRYRLGNSSFSSGDALGWFCMLNIIKPRKVIEIGSGWSSAVLLDTNEYCFNGKIECSFIEPYAELLRNVIKCSDNVDLQEISLQEIPLSYFDKLESGDVLFVDSTHVSKYGSDVNYLFFSILPRLKSGVYIHIHDIFYPMTYPHAWIKKGFVLNEAYLLHAFLQYNKDFEIVYYQNYMEKKKKEEYHKNFPLPSRESMTGGSFWMRKKL